MILNHQKINFIFYLEFTKRVFSISLILLNTFFYIVIPEIVQLFTLWTVFKELFGFLWGGL